MPKILIRTASSRGECTTQRLFWLIGASFLVATGLVATVHAATSQGFKTTESLVSGTLVSSDEQKPGTVAAANLDRASRLLGVVVSPSDTLVNVVTGDQSEVQVATSDAVPTLVSNLNGDIKAGDKVAVSFINGVGAKPTVKTRLIGVAQADLTDKMPGVKKQTVTPKGGKPQEVLIGAVPLQIQISDFVPAPDDKSAVPKFIQELANSVAGKKVSPGRILLGGAVMLIALIAISGLLYGATRSSIISIGRNPLSKSAVERSLFQVIIVVLIILAAAMGGVYLILAGS